MALPDESSDLGEAAFRVLATDPIAARSLIVRQLALIEAEEKRTGQSLHKGQPLHNLGVITYQDDTEAARTLFHAAHLEDMRTTGHGARAEEVLRVVYGERPSALDDLVALARPDEGSLAAAQRFADKYAPFAAHRNYLGESRAESELDAHSADELVFVGGAHRLNPYLVAISSGVIDAGLTPVVVAEFANARDDNDFSKSVRFMKRCGAVLLDVSEPSGAYLELGLLYGLKLPALLLFGSNRVDAKAHGGMVRGIATTMGIEARACTTTGQMEEEARAWCIAHRDGTPRSRPTKADLKRSAAVVEQMLSGSNQGPTMSGDYADLGFGGSAVPGRLVSNDRRDDP